MKGPSDQSDDSLASSPNCVCHNGSFTPYVSRAGHSRGTTRCSKICALDRCGPKNTEPCRLHGSVNPIRDILLTTEKRSIAMQTVDMIGCRRWQAILLADEYLQSSPLLELPRSARQRERLRLFPFRLKDCVRWSRQAGQATTDRADPESRRHEFRQASAALRESINRGRR